MLTYRTLLVPFIAWLLMGYFKTVPKELEEQAMIDGASRWRAMTRIILPLCLPGFLSAGIFAFTLSQNEFLYALLFLSKSSVRTVPIGVVGELIRGDAFYWGQLMAGALLGSIPVALVYSFFVKYYVAGLTARDAGREPAPQPARLGGAARGRLHHAAEAPAQQHRAGLRDAPADALREGGHPARAHALADDAHPQAGARRLHAGSTRCQPPSVRERSTASSASWARRPSSSEGDGLSPLRMPSRKRFTSGAIVALPVTSMGSPSPTERGSPALTGIGWSGPLAPAPRRPPPSHLGLSRASRQTRAPWLPQASWAGPLAP